MNTEYKDWQVAQMMFGKNTKHECKLVSELRKYGIIDYLCDGYSIIYDKRLTDTIGYLIPNIICVNN